MNKELYNEIKEKTIKELEQYLQRISETQYADDEEFEVISYILLGMTEYRIEKNYDPRPFITHKIRNDVYMFNSPYHDEFNKAVDASLKEANLELRLLKNFEKYLRKSIKYRVYDIDTMFLMFYTLIYISSMQKNREKYLIENARILKCSSSSINYIPGEEFSLEEQEIIDYFKYSLKIIKAEKRELRKARYKELTY